MSSFATPMDCSLPGSSVDGILQARMLEVVAIPGGLPDPGTEPRFPVLQADSLMTEPPGKPICRWSTPIIKLLLLILKVIVLYSVMLRLGFCKPYLCHLTS